MKIIKNQSYLELQINDIIFIPISLLQIEEKTTFLPSVFKNETIESLDKISRILKKDKMYQQIETIKQKFTILAKNDKNDQIEIDFLMLQEYIELLIQLCGENNSKIQAYLYKLFMDIISLPQITKNIKPSNINKQFEQFYNLNSLILFKIRQQIIYQKNGIQSDQKDLIKNLLYTNDIHNQDLSDTFTFLVQQLLNSEGENVKYLKDIETLLIQQISQKLMYQMTETRNQQIYQPVGYDSAEIENLYVNDYKNILIKLCDCLQVYIQHNTIQNQQLLIEFNIQNYDKFAMIVRLLLNQLIINLPPVILIHEGLHQIVDIYEKIYYLLIQIVIISQNQTVQHIILITIENYIRIFLPIIPNETIYDLICVFYNNCLDIQVTNNIQLTNQIIQHLIRLFVNDSETSIDQYEDSYRNDINIVNYVKEINISKQIQQLYIQQRIRLVMPGIILFTSLFNQFDCSTKYGSVFTQMFAQIYKLSQQKELVQQVPQNQQCKFYKNIINRLEKEIQLIKQHCNNVQLIQELEKFLETLYGGQENAKNQIQLNNMIEIQYNQHDYTYDTLSQGLGCFCSRFQQEFTNFILISQKIPNNNITETIGLKTATEQDFINLNKKLLLNKLSNNKDPFKVLMYFLQNNEQYVKLFNIETINIEESIKDLMKYQKEITPEITSKKKRSFDESLDFNMTQVANFYVENQDQFYKILQFVILYIKLQESGDQNIGITKEAFGEIIGGGKPQQKAALYLFNCVIWKNFQIEDKTNYVAYIRKYLSLFKLPGEGQIVDRILMQFTYYYCLLTKKDQKTSHALAYAIIQLNTDLHNNNVRENMTMEQFIKNTQGINYDQSLTDELLKDIYEQIKSQPFTLSTIEQIKSRVQLYEKYFQDKSKNDKRSTPEINDILYLPINIRQNLYQLQLFQTSISGIKTQQQIKYTFLSFDEQFLKTQFNSIEQNLISTIIKLNLEKKNSVTCNGIKFGLLLCFNNIISNQQLSKTICDTLVSQSEFLQVPLISFRKYDVQDPFIYEQNNQSTDYKFKSIQSSQLDSLLALLQLAYHPISQLPQGCYLGQYSIGEAWNSIISVCSRIQYFQYLIEKQIGFVNKNQRQKITFMEFKQAVYQKFYEKVQQIQFTQLIQEYSYIYTYLQSSNIIKYAEFVLQNNQRFNIDQKHYICCSLAEQIKLESQITITTSYHLCSADYLNLILTQLYQESCEQFQNTFKIVCTEYKYLFKHQNETVSQSALDGIYQVVCAYIAVVKLNLINNKQQILLVNEIFLDPFNQYLELSMNSKQLWFITERLTSFMQYIQYKVNEQSETITICPFSEQFLIKLNTLIHQSVYSSQVIFMKTYTKDISLGTKQRQKLIPKDIKQVLKLTEKYIQLMQKYNKSLLKVQDNYSSYQQNLKSYCQIIEILLTQDLSSETTEFVQEQIKQYLQYMLEYMKSFESITDNLLKLQNILAQNICQIVKNILVDRQEYTVEAINNVLNSFKTQIQNENKQQIEIVQQFIEILIIQSIKNYDQQQFCNCEEIHEQFIYQCQSEHCQAESYLRICKLSQQRLKNILNVIINQQKLSTSFKLITLEIVQQLLQKQEIKYLIQNIQSWEGTSDEMINLQYQVILIILQFSISQQCNIEDTFEFAIHQYIKYQSIANDNTISQNTKLIINILQAATQFSIEQLSQNQIMYSLIRISQTLLRSKTLIEPKRSLLNVLLQIDRDYVKENISEKIFEDICQQINIYSTQMILQLVQQFILIFYNPQYQNTQKDDTMIKQSIIQSQIIIQNDNPNNNQEEPFDISSFQ